MPDLSEYEAVVVMIVRRLYVRAGIPLRFLGDKALLPAERGRIHY